MQRSFEWVAGAVASHKSQVRLHIAYQLGDDYGIPLAEVALELGVSTSDISKAITRRMKEYVNLVNNVPEQIPPSQTLG